MVGANVGARVVGKSVVGLTLGFRVRAVGVLDVGDGVGCRVGPQGKPRAHNAALYLYLALRSCQDTVGECVGKVVGTGEWPVG